jgi:hypothetical protein
MKKHSFISFLLLFHAVSFCQLPIPTAKPCNDAELLKITGRWVKESDYIRNETINLNKAQQQEVLNRIDAMHKLVQEALPRLMGVDAPWHRSLSYSLFGPQYKYYTNSNDILTHNFIGGIPVCSFQYHCGIYPYHCNYNSSKSEAVATYPGESGSTLWICANGNVLFERKNADDTMLVNGYPVYMRHPVKEMWKGYELLTDYEGSGTAYVLIHRNGMLPYIPVTRKQYLDCAISQLTGFFDNLLKSFEQITDKELKEDYKRKTTKNKNDVLKLYKDELDKTTRSNLLNSPAIILQMLSTNPDVPVFTTEDKYGKMLVIENPAYMRRDLPKYIPQSFVLQWNWMTDTPSNNFSKMIEKDFPVEKLQAMIDK